MASSSSNLDLLYTAQASKELTANALFDAGSPATLFGRRESLCSGLDWFWYGGTIVVDGVLTQISNNSVALTLTATQTNYLEADRSGTVTANTTGFTAGRIPLYTVVCGSSAVTSYTDQRAWVQPRYLTAKATASVASADWTLSAAEARCNYLTVTGTIGVNRNVIVPNDWTGIVYNNTSGAFTLTVKTASGSGIVVGTGKRAILLADGTNVVRITPDA